MLLTVLGRMGAEAGRVACLPLQWVLGWLVRWGSRRLAWGALAVAGGQFSLLTA